MGFLDWLFGSDDSPAEGVPYKGYVIHPAPLKIAQVYGVPPGGYDPSGQWRLHLYVTKGEGEASSGKEFNAANSYKKKKEAIKHCIEFGKQIIDGEIETATVKDL